VNGVVQFTVFGVPQPQGSTRAFMAGGRPIITSSNKNLGQWRQLISDVSQKYATMHEGAVWVHLEFILPRPKSLAKKQTRHTKRPDVDKLIRAVCDSLTGIMWHDDSQVVEVWARKFYCHPDDDPQPCVRISLGER
jgi:Holliday junction resolvase RusA-like endonuclease